MSALLSTGIGTIVIVAVVAAVVVVVVVVVTCIISLGFLTPTLN